MGLYVPAGPAGIGLLSATPPYQHNRWYFLPNIAAIPTTNSGMGTNVARGTPFFITSTVTLTQIGHSISSAGDVGSTYRVAIYADDGTGRAGNLLAELGSFNGNSATVQTIGGLNVTLSPGLYHIIGTIQNVTTTQPGITVHGTGPILPGDTGTTLPAALANPSGSVASSIPGAYPSVFPYAQPNNSNSMPRFFAMF